MAEDEFVEENKKEESQILLEKTSGSSPQQKQLLKKQAEFELGEKERAVEEISDSKKNRELEFDLGTG